MVLRFPSHQTCQRYTLFSLDLFSFLFSFHAYYLWIYHFLFSTVKSLPPRNRFVHALFSLYFRKKKNRAYFHVTNGFVIKTSDCDVLYDVYHNLDKASLTRGWRRHDSLWVVMDRVKAHCKQPNSFFPKDWIFLLEIT